MNLAASAMCAAGSTVAVALLVLVAAATAAPSPFPGPRTDLEAPAGDYGKVSAREPCPKLFPVCPGWRRKRPCRRRHAAVTSDHTRDCAHRAHCFHATRA